MILKTLSFSVKIEKVVSSNTILCCDKVGEISSFQFDCMG